MQRPTAIFDGTGGRTREKRGLERSDGDDAAHPEPKKPKVPALASVIVEALKVDSLQKLCSSLEPILRKVVSEEVERALAKLGPAKLTGRSSPKRIEGPDGSTLQLQFRSRLSCPLFTGGKVEGEQGTAILVVLVDSEGNAVTMGPQSLVKLDVVVLEGDFNNEDDDDWTEEEFESHVVKEREGKRPLLTGDLQVTLKEGVGALGELTFTDNSSWIRSRKFRLGLRVSAGYSEGIRIREAKTEAFSVRDHRGELYKKHYPPALNDDVWRLEKIGKDGSFHKRLNKAGIHTVEDFLRLVVRDPQRLRSVLGGGMSNKMWESLVEHAKTCVLTGKHYVYYQDDSRNVGVLFNNIYELRGLIAGDQYYPAENLDESQKVYIDSLVKKAYDNWMHVVEYDGRALLGSKQKKKNDTSGSAATLEQVDQFSFERPLVVSVPSDHSSGSSLGGVTGPTGYVENEGGKYLPSSHPTSNAELQFEHFSFAPQTGLHDSSLQHQMSETMSLALGPPQSSGLGYLSLPSSSSHQTSNLNPYSDWPRHRDNGGTEDFFSEEEIRMRSHEILENDDMQQLLRVFNMGGSGVNMSDEGYSYPTFMPTPSPNYGYYEGNRSSGKAVVGWLKLKAALRWGIFIRKRAAERRAQLVELDD